MAKYFSRVADDLLVSMLKRKSAVQIKGPKWCGKTETAKQQASSVLYMQDPDTYTRNMTTAELKPSLLLEGDTPRLIDEWQVAPVLWDAVRFAVDKDSTRGRFILTGSAVPGEKPLHSGTGRFAFLRMRPMSLFESKESSAEVSLKSLFDEMSEVNGTAALGLEDTVHALARGGWPEAVISQDRENALSIVADYLNAVCTEDISRADGVSRNPEKVFGLLRSYARCSASQAADTTLQQDMISTGQSISLPTLASYLDALTDIFVVETLSAWHPRLRSKTVIRTSPTRHFVDPSIAVAALGANQASLLRDPETLGLLFESLCVRDLRTYCEALGGNVFHYRDRAGFEADAVLTLPDGRWGLVEVKLSSVAASQAADNLVKLSERIDQINLGKPAFLMVLTTGDYAITLPNGVHVVPLSCMAP